ncbi:MAG: hypothetical protein ACRBK7_12705 [Acidimicrobiales bacterium]
MTSPDQNHHKWKEPWKRRSLWKNLSVLLLAVGLMATTTAVVGAQEPPPNLDTTTVTQGTCADLGMSVVEPISVSWASDSSPVRNPKYLWAYGDVDLLWDNSFDDYWFHWYNAVPGPDPYVVYQFEPGTVIEAVQFTNDWSSGDLQLVGLDGLGQSVSGTNTVPLDDPYVSHVAAMTSMAVAAVKMTTSTQQVKLLEVDFCGEADTEVSLDLAVSTPGCESIAANWTQQPGANHQIVVVDSGNTQVDSQTALVGSYGPTTVPAGTYTVTLTATSATGSITASASVTATECSGPILGCGSANDPADAYCDSLNVIDSFGDAPLPQGADTGMRWNTVSEYYSSFGNRPGMCSIDVHNSYWTAVRSADGALRYYPSWHPPIHDPGGPDECRFTHEHGVDARNSDLYDEDHPTNIGVPFGFVHPGTGGTSGRVEDHVGHKVVVENDLQLTTNNPYGEGITLSLFEPNGQPVTCDWYSKLHQGTHGPDALGFNMHEYFLNYSCDDGTDVRIKEMTDFGFQSPTDAGVDTPNFALSGGSGTVSSCEGWFTTNLPGPGADPDPSDDSDFGDAGRGFSCLMSDAKIEELWKPSAYLSAPDGAGTLAYDPYYVVMNPNRFALYEWWDFLEQDGDHVGENAMISMVDFCVEGSELRNELMRPSAPGNFVKSGWNLTGKFRVQTYCDSIESSVLAQWASDIDAAGGDNATLMAERKGSVDNAFLGTRRGVHTKGPVVYGREANFGSLAFFCSDHFGNGSVWPTNPDTGASVTTDDPWSAGDPTPVCDGRVPQLLSTFHNDHGAVEGSTAGATVTGGGFQSNGPASEITIDMDALYPDHGIQAPN